MNKGYYMGAVQNVFTGTSGPVSARMSAGYLELVDLRVRVSGAESEEEKIYCALSQMGEDILAWYVDLERKPRTWKELRELLIKKGIAEDEEREKREEEEKQYKMLMELIGKTVDREFEKLQLVIEKERKRDRQNGHYGNTNQKYVRKSQYKENCANKLKRKIKHDPNRAFGGTDYQKREKENGIKRRRLTLDALKKEFPSVIMEYAENEKIKFCKVEKCRIDTEEGKTVVKRGQRIPQSLKEKVRKYLDSLEAKGIIRKSTSQWRNPIRAMEKPNGDIRLVSNLMALNDLAIKDTYKIPEMRRIIEATAGSEHITVLDLKEGYYQIEIVEEHKHKTAFEFEDKVYEWNGMVMGYKNAPMVFQRIMNTVLSDYIGKGIEIYLDDIIIHANNIENHDYLVRKVFERLKENNLKVNMKKVQFAQREVKLLGVTVNGKEKIPIEIKRNEALEFPKPRCVSELRRFLGLAGWFREFIKDLYHGDCTMD
jgi:Reverse transcriptase (RNA-dependent DNA polymerase)